MTRAAILLFGIVILGAWFVLQLDGETESASTITIEMTDAPDPVSPGGVVTYTITVENTGTEETFVDLDDTLAGPGTISSVEYSPGTCAIITNTTFTCALGLLAVGDSATIVVEKLTTDSIGGFPDTGGPPLPTTDGYDSLYVALIAGAAMSFLVLLGFGYASRRPAR